MRRSRSRDFLVVSEIALTLMMLASAGLLLRSFVKLNQVDPGFRIDHLLVMSIDMTSSAYEDRESSRTLFQRLMDRINAFLSELPPPDLDSGRRRGPERVYRCLLFSRRASTK